MKRILTLLITIGLSLCLIACGETVSAKATSENDIEIDVDLTQMSSTMIYSEVYNIMSDPDRYLGKTIRIQGDFRAYSYPELGDQYYYAVVIPDATACCEQGFEFIWDGEHEYPKDYPEENTAVEITGVFGQYEEDGYDYYYLRTDAINKIS